MQNCKSSSRLWITPNPCSMYSNERKQEQTMSYSCFGRKIRMIVVVEHGTCWLRIEENYTKEIQTMLGGHGFAGFDLHVCNRVWMSKILPLDGESMIQFRCMLSSQISQSTGHVPGCSIGCIHHGKMDPSEFLEEEIQTSPKEWHCIRSHRGRFLAIYSRATWLSSTCIQKNLHWPTNQPLCEIKG